MYGDGALLDAAPCEFEQNDSADVAFGLPCDDTATNSAALFQVPRVFI